MLEEHYENQAVLNIIKRFGEDEELQNFNYLKLFELLEGHLL